MVSSGADGAGSGPSALGTGPNPSQDGIPKVYFFGTSCGQFVKIGYTLKPLEKRRRELLRGQLSSVDLFLLAAVNGTSVHEREIQRIFIELEADVNSDETFNATVELLEYINWLRQQWWAYVNINEHVDETPNWNEWMPTPERRVSVELDSSAPEGQLFSDKISYTGALANTAWKVLSTPSPKLGQDYYTPAEIVQAARESMGGIDLDAASHWQANRVHKIPKYFHLHRSAFDNAWEGRVWLNPPYGEYLRWFDQICKYWDDGQITQLCMLSPVWAFTTAQASEIRSRTSAMVLLTPTPQFWGNPQGKTGSNHPHAVIYLGSRIRPFFNAFSRFGIPFQLIQPEALEKAA